MVKNVLKCGGKPHKPDRVKVACILSSIIESNTPKGLWGTDTT